MPTSDGSPLQQATLSCMVALVLAGSCPRLVVASQVKEGEGIGWSFQDDREVGEAQDATAVAAAPSDAELQIRLLELLTATPGLDGEELADKLGENVHRVTTLLDDLESHGLLVETE